MRIRLCGGLVAVSAVLAVPSAGATLPGYNGLLAFFSAPAPYLPNIWTMTPDGTDQTDITPSVDAINPAWSPDGTKIVYVRDEGTSHEIWVMNADGSGQTRLTSGYFDDSPAWSPDGSEIAFGSTRPHDGSGYLRHVWVMNSDGSNLRQLTDDTTTPNHAGDNPDWSPDGARIVFDDGRDIFAINADGSHVTQLTTDPGMDIDPNYSPDGQKVAFVSNRADGHGNIYVMNADGTGQTALTAVPFPITSMDPVWSPDGTKIAFATDRDGYLTQMQIWVMNADGTNQTALITDGNTREGRPSWQRTATPPISTSTLLSCAPSAVTVGTATTCTVTVADTGAGAAIPIGSVQFASSGAGSFSHGGACGLSAGSCQVTYTPSSVASGAHRITAAYQGNWNHTASSTSKSITVTPLPVTLTVSRTGNGSGTITSNPAGISCGSACSHAFAAGTSVTLTATATVGLFNGWSGACTGSGTCTVTTNANQAVTANFVIPIGPGPTLCVVPKVKGKTLKTAKRAIKSRHCTVGNVGYAFSKSVTKGHVISQKPKPGRRLVHGAKVSLAVSKGTRIA